MGFHVNGGSPVVQSQVGLIIKYTVLLSRYR